MPRYLFDVHHFDGDYLEDNPAGVELPDDTAAQEFALKVMRGLVQSLDEDWTGWTMEVTEGGRPVWRRPFDAIPPRKPLLGPSAFLTWVKLTLPTDERRQFTPELDP